MKNLRIHILLNSHSSRNIMSGGERIIMECARRWAKKNKVFSYTSNIGILVWNKYKVNNVTKIKIMDLRENQNMFLVYLMRPIIGILKLRKLKLNSKKGDILYSSSDFWPDSIPAFIIKLRNPEVKWIAGFYLFAPKPWQKDSPYKGKRWFIGSSYWLTQLPVYWVIKRYADMVFVTSEPDVEKFVTKNRNRDKIVVIRGGVDIKPAIEYLSSGNAIAVEKRKYDACFVGRFHPQKGVSELIDIWKLVCDKKPKAKLAMIGIGVLENEAKNRIAELGLNDNIDLLGFKDGEEKYEIFKQSKIVVHPATYDSGGMAACEAMAWGLPGISFDLEALKTYYPKGMLKTPCFNLKAFADNIIKLLKDEELYEKIQKDALAWTKEWDWDKRAKKILEKINIFTY